MRIKFLIVLLCALSTVACIIGLSACNLLESSDDSGNSEHTHTIEHYDVKEATCLKDGMKEHWRCTSCGDYFSDENGKNKVSYSSLVVKGEHKEVTDKGYAKTCTTDGLTDGKHCSVCNEVIVAQKVIPAGHTEVIIEAIPKTCQYAGSTEGKKCSVCGEVTLKPQVVPAGHTIVTDEGKEATCTQTGLTDGEHCEKCNYVKAQEVIPAKGHTEVIDSAVPATCITDGKTEGKHCSECSAVLKAQTVIPANGHTEVIDPAEEATCANAGKTEGKHCSVCSAVIVAQNFIPKKGHTPVIDPAVEATCTHAGKTEGKHCSVCQAIIVAQQNTPIKSHSGSKICNTCGKLMVAASTGLTFNEITELPYEVTSALGRNRRNASSGLTVIGVEVTGRCSCTDTDIVIPETINGLPVLGIAADAFSGMSKNETLISSLTVPNGIKYIGACAFIACPNLSEVNLADSIEYIGDDAFRASAVRHFKCPANLKQLCSKQFVGCMSLQTVIINASIERWNGMDLSIIFLANPSLVEIFFEGTREQWDALTNMGNFWQEDAGWYGSIPYSAHATRISFYSETTPTGSDGYWHYAADGVTPVRW